MAISRGKQFEKVVQRDIQKIPGILCYRLYDLTNGFRGSNNASDFIVYKKPNFYFVECKTIHGTSIPLDNLIQLQRMNSYLQNIDGARGYFIIWFVDHQCTFVVDSDVLNQYSDRSEVLVKYLHGDFKKSLNYKELLGMVGSVEGVFCPPAVYKKVFGQYDFSKIF